MQQYKDLVRDILDNGEVREDRTGTGTLSIFGGHIKFDLRERFPLVQCKDTRWRTAFLEMLFFLRGEGNTKWLNEQGCKLWDSWANSHGELGPVYGVNWRGWKDYEEVDGYNGAYFCPYEIDQVKEVIDGVIKSPHARRHIVSAWNVGDLGSMALPPCHFYHQLYASGNEWLDMQVGQRSWDVALGAPFNISQYAMLLHLYARATGRKARYMHFSYGDAHIYLDHVDAMKEVIEREYEQDNAQLVISTDNVDIDGYKIDDFAITGYNPMLFVKMKVSV